MSSIIAYMQYEKGTNAAITNVNVQRRLGMAELGSRFAAQYLLLPPPSISSSGVPIPSDTAVDTAVENVIKGVISEAISVGSTIKRYRLTYSSTGLPGAGEYDLAFNAASGVPAADKITFTDGASIYNLELVVKLDRLSIPTSGHKRIKMNISLSRNTHIDLLSASNYLGEVVNDIVTLNAAGMSAEANEYALGSITFRRCK